MKWSIAYSTFFFFLVSTIENLGCRILSPLFSRNFLSLLRSSACGTTITDQIIPTNCIAIIDASSPVSNDKFDHQSRPHS